MVLIIGGAYQGKLEFAKETLGITDVYTCNDDEIDFSKDCIYHFEFHSDGAAWNGQT